MKKDIFFSNIEQLLVENMADFLDSDIVKLNENINYLRDPVKREKSNLHIKMAKAAMREYKSTILK